jgi:integrase
MLTELKIKNLKPKEKRYMVSDGQGLSIMVMPSGEKYWYVRTWDHGKETKRSLGRYPDISLKEARALRHTAELRRDTPVVFADIVEEWFKTRYATMNRLSTVQDTRTRLDKYVIPAFGGREAKSIMPRDILLHVRSIQEKAPHQGLRVKTLLSQIFRYAIAAGLADWDPAAQVRGALLPLPPEQHRATVTDEVSAASLLRAIEGYEGNKVVRLGLLLLAYTFVRPTEMRCAEWSELDLDAALWMIPAERMKMNRGHVVPLSTQVVASFLQLRRLSPHPLYCFALPCKDKPMSKTAFSVALCSLGYGTGKATPHSFRGMASTLLNENGFPSDVIERQLAHVEKNAVRAAYNHAEYLPERRRMMQWWADYLDDLAKK